MTPAQLLAQAKSVAREPYAWPGGYPRILVMHDGEALCPKCCRAEFRQIAYSTIRGITDGWTPAGADIHWEGMPLVCAHCGGEIESAYGCAEMEQDDE